MAAVSPDTNMGASGDEADNSISSPSLSSTSPCRTDSPRREAVTPDDVADGLLDEYDANAHDDVADGLMDEYEATYRARRTDIPRSGRLQMLRKLASLPRGVAPLSVEAAPIGVKPLARSSDDAGGEHSHVDTSNDDGDDDDDHISDVDGDASHHDEQSSPQAPRDSSSQHGRNGSSNPSLTSPAPEPHDDNGASTEQTDAHDPTPTGQFLSLLPPLLSRAQRRSS